MTSKIDILIGEHNKRGRDVLFSKRIERRKLKQRAGNAWEVLRSKDRDIYIVANIFLSVSL